MILKLSTLWLRTVLSCTILLLSLSLYGQIPGVNRCATVEMDSILHAQNPNLQSNEEFEEWMQKLITEQNKKAESQLIIGGVYQIPVVVHVVHNGEAVGTGTNVSYAAIQSQIDVLNEDFRKMLGTAGYNTHPDGADTKIEFCLSRRRPDGSAFPGGEDGVNRINRNTAGFSAPPYSTTYINATIKTYTFNGGVPTATRGWDPGKYMNIWLCDISGGVLGYAQFPTSPIMDGTGGCGTQSQATDGVVFLYNSIGKSSVTGYPGPYNEGRTATHEIGHWLGLRHIWGDGDCTVDDYCADTPLSDAANFGCPVTNSCTDPAPDPNDMVENYMDYTDDACMNIFTYDQKQRMRIVLENSVIRATLITSDACVPPAVSDASIVDIINPDGDNCAGAITPTVVLRNRGSSTLTSATIKYTIDGGTPTSFSWTGSITTGNSANVALPAFTATLGTHTFKSYTELPNGVVDPNTLYDTSSVLFAVSNGYQPNYTQDFEAGVFPPDLRWSVVNPNSDCYEWVGQTCTSSTGVASNSAAMMPNYNNGTNQDEYLYSPLFILPCNATAANLTFDKAYRRRAAGNTDRLRVEISEDCGATWNATTLFDQAGTALQTVTTTSNSYWIPNAAGNWANVNINLLPYVTSTSKKVQFRFRATNAGNGGNLYVDNVRFTAVTPGEIEVAVGTTQVLDGGYYDYGSTTVGSPTTATFTITNPGTSNLILTGPIAITGSAMFTLNTTFGTTTVPAGGSTTFSIDFTPTGAGPYTANVSFNTNDCDEGVYDFTLNGSGNVSPPTANFVGAPTTICQGATVTYTNTSTGATSYAWSFPGGTPATATGAGPHVVTYNTVGTFNAQLTATNAYGSNVKLNTNYITVLSGIGGALPVTQGFTTGTFPPTNWSIGNGGNQTSTWIRSTTAGTAPTAGNSAYINMFTTNTSGDSDSLYVEPVNLSGYASAQLTFDVAYARYSATYQDRMQVLVSADCGQTWTVVYDKAGSVLATDPDQTAAYTSPSTWRNETIDLTPYVGNQKVQVAFNGLSGWGQYIYIDNVNLTGVVSACNNPTVPTVTYTPTTVCEGSTATLNIAGTLNDATTWSVYSGSCGGTLVGTTATSSIVVTPGSPSTTYYVRGTGGCVTPGSCGSVTVNVTSLQNAGFNYSSASYCTNAADPTPTITGVSGGTFTSSPAGMSINASTGVIDVSASTPGTYTVTYTTAGPCPGTSNVSVTINAAPTAPTISASGPTAFCAGGSVTLTSSQATGNVWSTGATSQSIVVSTAGSYTVTYTNGSGCSATSSATAVTVNALPAVPTISASGPLSFCAGGSVTLTSSQATGNVWSTGATSQSIVVSSAGSYTVTYTNGSGCSRTSAATVVTVNANPSAPTILASGPTTFCAGGSVTLTSSQATGNVWSTGATSQSIVVSTSGSYTVTFTNGSGCSATSAATAVTVNPNPSAPTISASGPLSFCTSGSVTLTSSQATGNVWSTGATSQSIVVSTAGSYTVTYTNGSGCSATSAATAVTVNANPSVPTISASGPLSFCAGGSVTLTSSQATGNVWSTGATSQSIVVSTAGSYTVTYTNGSGCSATSSATSVTVNANPSAPTITAIGPTTFCAGGSVTLTSSQGAGNVWSTGSTSNNITVSTTGSYTVTYTDGSGCSATSAATAVTVNPAPTIASGAATNPTTCGTSTGSIQVTGSGTGTVSWTGTASGSSGSVTLPYTITGLAAGSYTITFNNGCTSNALVVALTDPTPPVAPTISASGPLTFCAGGSVTLTSSYASGNLWSTGATSQSIVVSAGGNYSVTFTNGSGCSASSAATTVIVNPLPAVPTITASGPTAFCAGGSVTLTSSQATGNVWSTGATSQSIVVSTAGSYTVTYTDGSSCSATSAATAITVNANPSTPTISTSGTTTFCAGGSVDLTASQATGVVWSTGATTQTITVTTGGSYTVTYTNGSGCSATSAATAVTVNPIPVIAQGTTTNPTGCGTSDGTIQITGTGTGVVTWSGTILGNSGSVTLPYTMTGLPSGSYGISFIANGCASNIVNVTLTNPTAPSPPTIGASGPLAFCAGGSVTLTSSQATGNVWSTGATSQSIVVSTAGSYTVTYTNGAGCSATSSTTTVTVNANPSAPMISASGSTALCAGGSVVLTSSQATGNVWSTGATTQSITVSTAGSYFVTYTNGSGCSATSPATSVTVNANPTAPSITPSGATTFCLGGSVDLTSSQATGNVWSTTETSQTISASSGGSYTVTYTDGNGCSATSSPLVVTVNANPAAPSITPSGATSFCVGGSVDLTSSQTSGNTWSTTEVTQTITVNTSGNYTVTYTDGNGCSATSAPTSVVVNALPSAPVITASGSTSLCAGGSVNLISSETVGNVWSTTEVTQAITVSTAGSYSVTYTDGNGCSATSAPTSVIVNALPSAPVITTSGPTTICAGGSVDLTSSQATGNDWSTTETTQTITVNSAGSYTVTYTDGNGCSSTSAPTSVAVNALPTVSLTAFDTVCEQADPFSLFGGSPSGGIYTGPAVSGGVFDPSAAGAGTYTMTYEFTDGNGCVNNAQQDLVVEDCSSLLELVEGGILLYPNPTSGVVYVSSDYANVQAVRVFDGAGRLVSEIHETGTMVTVDLSSFARGVYSLEVDAGGLIFHSRIVKQ